ncbi:hypothetical protein EUGRSUZ_G00181 [Eucalyptus grandis]|uniref:Uncharacterized protein n=2 Tax=Eucalyptus grandis TaxID=71139 RepID=A0ACC3K0M5_EUCGR|nr:hypothetical protein EUGRSUZ_G00181 [Eucalyptus grandis]
MESELYEVAVEGNVHSLLTLLSKDRTMVGNQTESPLHIAAMLGQSGFVEEVLTQKTEMAKEQNSQGLTPLAVAKGYFHIVKNLLRVDPEVCFFRDKYGRNPLHVTAMKGHVDILEILVRVRSSAA